MNLIRQESDPTDIEVNLLDKRVIDAEIVLITHLANHPETAFPIGLITDGSKGNCISASQVDGSLSRACINLTLVDIEC